MKKIWFIIIVTFSVVCRAQTNIPELVTAYCDTTCEAYITIMGSINNQLMVATLLSRTQAIYTYSPSGLVSIDDFSNRHPYMYIPPVTYKNKFYYWAPTASGDMFNLCSWDGMVPPEVLGSYIRPGNLCICNDKIYFSTTTGTTSDFYEFDIAAKKERRINDRFISQACVYKDKLYFPLLAPGLGYELFSFDPATDKLTMVADLYEGPDHSYPRVFTEVDGKLYFVAYQSGKAFALFEYDGVKLPGKLASVDTSLFSNQIAYIHKLLYANGKLYAPFSNFYKTIGGIYEYDLIKDSLTNVIETDNYSSLSNAVIYRDELFFTNIDSNNMHYPEGVHMYAYHTKTGAMRQLPDPKETTGNTMQSGFVYNDALYYDLYSPEIFSGLFKYYEPAPFSSGASLYPNPANDKTYIKTGLEENNVLTVIMHDAVGRLISQQRLGIYGKGDQTIEIPLQHLASGMYICTLRGSKRVLFRGKLVKR